MEKEEEEGEKQIVKQKENQPFVVCEEKRFVV